MSGPIIVPPSVNYPAPIVSIPTVYRNAPAEGPRMIPLSLNWEQAGANNSMYINTSQNTPNPISQICALTVDNTRCGADVIFVFTDTQQTTTVPAGESVTAAVFTGSLAFYAMSPNAIPGDVTSVIVHNTVPPALDINTSRFVSTAAASITASGSASEIVPYEISGTLLGIICSAFNMPSTGSGGIVISDDTNTLRILGAFTPQSGEILNIQNIALRFTNGLTFETGFAAYPTGAEFLITAFYSVP